MNKPLTEINKKLDEFIRSIERIKGRAAFIEGLRRDGWQGDDEQILEDHAWLMLPKGATEEPKPKEPEPDEDDLEIDDEEDSDNSDAVKIKKGW